VSQMGQARGANANIAEFLLRNPVRATALGIEELAAHIQTSTASLSRFARVMGYEGFAALRAGMAKALQDALEPVFYPVEKLRGALQRPPSGGGNPVQAEGLQATQSNVQLAVAGISPERLDAISRRILGAQSVYTLGFGISSHLAAMLALDIQPFCVQCINVVEYGGTEVAAGRLMNIGKKDLLLAISFPRYASDAVTLTQYARDRGAHIVALTDSVASPLVALADDVLLAPCSHPVLSSSYAAAVVVAEALVASLMVGGNNHVEQAAKLTEAISAYLYSERSAPSHARPTRHGPARS
jgi:DNA-binding MurR/RpiR family transcriptional regulator